MDGYLRAAAMARTYEPVVLSPWGFAAGQGPGPGRERYRQAARMASGCGIAPAASLVPDAIPLYLVMPQLHIETFRAPTMIMGTFGQYLAKTTHDHEAARAEGAFVPGMPCGRGFCPR